MYNFGNNTFNTYGVAPTLEQLQSKILGPFDTVPYSDIVKQAYPWYAFAQEPFIGIKVLVRDFRAYEAPSPFERLRYLDSQIPNILSGQGCLMRETNYGILKDGFWIMTMPVPKSQLMQQLNNLGNVLSRLEREHGIVYQDVIDIIISGRCPLIDTERSMNQIIIPKTYKAYHIESDNSPYKIGGTVRINDEYLAIRSRWTLPRLDLFANIQTITSCVQGVFKCK